MLFDASHSWSGGANRVLLYSRELRSCGHTVVVGCLPGSELETRLKQEGIPVFTMNPRSDVNLFLVPEVIRLIREHDIDVIDINSPKFYWIAAIAGKLTGKSVIITRNVPFRKTGIKKYINRILYYYLVDRIIAISDKIKRELIADFEIDDIKIAVIYDGIDLSRFSRRDPDSGRSQNEYISAGIISRLVNGKGLECLIDAIPEIIKAVPNINFVVCGTGVSEQSLKLQAQNLNIANRITFLGFKDNIPELLSGMDITIMPSPEEGMSMSALESMASGVPVVATTGGGLVDIIADMENGVIVTPGNPRNLAEGAIRLLKADYRKIGRAARGVVEEKFALKRVVSKYESLINTLVVRR